MKNTTAALSVLFLSLGAPALVEANTKPHLRRVQEATNNGKIKAKEDAEFWDRFLQGQGSLPPTTPATTAPVPVPVPVTPSPTQGPPPTEAPIPAPTTPAMTPNPTQAPVTPAPTDAPVTPAPTDAPTLAPVTPAPTDAPVPAPTATDPPVPAPTSPPVPAPTNPPTEAPVPQTAAPITPAPTEPAQECPTGLAVTCVLSDGTDCTDVEPPASGAGEGCSVEPTYTYTITNDSDDQERIYSLQVQYGGFTTSIGNFETEEVLINPGETITVTNTEEVDICGPDGSDALALTATLFTGPPISVDISITCVAEDGRECSALGVTTDPELCLLDLTYTYTITNDGLANTEFVAFSRTRNGETVDLLPLVSDPILPIGATISFQETEEINTCIERDFTTTTTVSQAPSADFTCREIVNYP